MNKQVVLLHGWGVNHKVFDDFLPLLQPFNAQAIDLMGYDGQTNEFILSQAVNQAAATWDGAVHLFGWSLGGFLALNIALRLPEKVKTLSLCCSFAQYAKADDYPAGVAVQGWEKYAHDFANNYSGSLKNFFRLNAMANPDKTPQFERLADKIMAFRQPEKNVLFSSQQAVIESNIREHLPNIQTPVLIISGEKDRITPPAMADYLQQHLPRATRLHLPNATHTPFIDYADICAAHLKEFWTKYA